MSDEVLKGAYSAELFADDIEDMRENGIGRGASIGWPKLDNLYAVPKGQWSVITGLSGSGKSTFMDNVFVQLAQNHGWKFLICSPENQPIKRHIAQLMEIFSGKKFGRPDPRYPGIRPEYYMTDQEFKDSYFWVCQHFHFINPPETDFTVDGIISLAQEVKGNILDFDGMILDPYNEIEHKRGGLNETDYVSVVLQKFRYFTRQLDIHFWFVAHPAKPQKMNVRFQASELNEETKKPVYQRVTLYDIAGSANWKNKCDFGLIVHRDYSSNTAPSTIEIEKVRFRENGARGEVQMYYDFLCSRFVERYEDLLFNQ